MQSVLGCAQGPQTDDISFSQLYLTDLDCSIFNAGTIPCHVCDTSPNAKLPTAGGLGTITAAVQMGTGWGYFVLGAGVMTRAGAPRMAPLSNTVTLWESGNKEKERVFKNTPLTAHILRRPLQSPTCLVT